MNNNNNYDNDDDDDDDDDDDEIAVISCVIFCIKFFLKVFLRQVNDNVGVRWFYFSIFSRSDSGQYLRSGTTVELYITVRIYVVNFQT